MALNKRVPVPVFGAVARYPFFGELKLDRKAVLVHSTTRPFLLAMPTAGELLPTMSNLPRRSFWP